jgi:predicted Fe-Mo cluster-binding NifX family protein
MGLTVAVASSDGKVINQHFGRCDRFSIFNIENDKEFKFLEYRETSILCVCGNSGHNDSSLFSNIFH